MLQCVQTSCVWPLLVDGGVGLLWESVGKADLPSDHFDSKKSRESVDLPLTGHPSPCLSTLPSGRVRSGVPCWTWTLMVALTRWLRFLIFLRDLLMLVFLMLVGYVS